MIALAWIGAALALFALATTVVNALTWPRGRANGLHDGAVSVLVPARDEAENIGDCVRAIAASRHAVREILVYDDGSTDGTSEILASLAAEVPHLRVLRGDGLPEGWVGKPHACHRLADAATGDLLVYVDADVRLHPDGLGRIASLLSDHDADLVTAVPHQRAGTRVEQALMPLLMLTYTSWLPLALIHRTQDPRVLAANGQVLALPRRVYSALGGFRAVRGAVVDDMALCRRAKERGHVVVFADGERIASCRMYTSGRALWEGFSKNLYEGIGGTPMALGMVIALYVTTFVAPTALSVAALAGWSELLVPAGLGVAANVSQRLIQAIRHQQPASTVLLHLASMIAFVALALNSWRWTAGNRVQWSGRTYVSRKRRAGTA